MNNESIDHFINELLEQALKRENKTYNEHMHDESIEYEHSAIEEAKEEKKTGSVYKRWWLGVDVLRNKRGSKLYRYWRTRWRDINGKRRAKTFPFTCEGERRAYEYRDMLIEKINRYEDGHTVSF